MPDFNGTVRVTGPDMTAKALLRSFGGALAGLVLVTFTALVQRLIAMVKAISAAAATAIPAGETTWGAVFIANGLQLILAILLIVLGLNIVFHSVKGYKASEKNSEKAAV